MLADDPRLDLLGHVDSAPTHIEARAAHSRKSAWNMQWGMTLRGLARGLETETAHAAHALDSRDLFPLRAVELCPLLPSAWPHTRIGWVPAALLVTDREHAFLAGPRGTRLSGTIWSTTDPGLVADASEAYLRCFEAARPWEEVHTRPRLDGRTLRTALEMGLGASDQEIATTLGVARRTAAAEVRKVVDWCGARSRGHAIAILTGAAR